MSVEFWLYPGVYMDVTSLTKVTLTPAAPGEVPPAGATVIPPQVPAAATPMANVIQSSVAANLEVARQGVAAAQAITEQQTREAQATFDAALAKTNEEAARISQAVIPAPGQPTGPPWSVTFTEKR